ncbi:MAG: DUF6428 family protein [Robiginitalea sp.]|jgi:hypothetical protein
MKTSRFVELLKENPRKRLGFEYQTGSFLRKDYHITEVKNVHISATDCGGRQDAWEETVIQLWEAPDIDREAPQIRGRKALQILERVAQKQPIRGESPLKFEYGNAHFHTSQLKVNGYRLQEEELIILLTPEHTTCKAGDLCGVPKMEEASETPCNPESGCC